MFVGPSEVSYSDVFTYIGGRLILICVGGAAQGLVNTFKYWCSAQEKTHLQGFRGSWVFTLNV